MSSDTRSAAVRLHDELSELADFIARHLSTIHPRSIYQDPQTVWQLTCARAHMESALEKLIEFAKAPRP